MEVINEKIHNSIEEKRITYENFFNSTRAVFVPCEKPSEEPYYISPVSRSEYYKGTDSNGDYVIRNSNHWIQHGVVFEKPKTPGACFWEMKVPQDKKIDTNIREISAAYSTTESFDFISGKCYLEDFKSI